MTWKPETDEIHRRRARALEMGGSDAVDRQHNKGRLTIRERIYGLLDPGSFDEIGQGAGASDEDGFTPANYVLGFGKIHGRRVVVGGVELCRRLAETSPGTRRLLVSGYPLDPRFL